MIVTQHAKMGVLEVRGCSKVVQCTATISNIGVLAAQSPCGAAGHVLLIAQYFFGSNFKLVQMSSCSIASFQPLSVTFMFIACRQSRLLKTPINMVTGAREVTSSNPVRNVT